MKDAAREKTTRPYTIESIADHLELIEQIAAWHWAEWGHADPGGSLASWTEGLRQRRRRVAIPTTFVALDGDVLLGAVTLIEHDMSTRPDLSPWLGGMIVKPDFRGQGVGSALVRHAVRQAEMMGVSRLYLHTAKARAFYERLGWLPFVETWYEVEPVSLMEYVTSDIVL